MVSCSRDNGKGCKRERRLQLWLHGRKTFAVMKKIKLFADDVVLQCVISHLFRVIPVQKSFICNINVHLSFWKWWTVKPKRYPPQATSLWFRPNPNRLTDFVFLLYKAVTWGAFSLSRKHHQVGTCYGVVTGKHARICLYKCCKHVLSLQREASEAKISTRTFSCM